MVLRKIRNFLVQKWRQTWNPNREFSHPNVKIGIPIGYNGTVDDYAGFYDENDIYLNCTFSYMEEHDYYVMIDVLCHEHLHYVLHKLEGWETSVDLDNIVDSERDQMIHNRVRDEDVSWYRNY